MLEITYRGSGRRWCGVVITAVLLVSGCLPWAGVAPATSGAIGTTSRGVLQGSAHMSARGEHYRFYRGGDRRYGVPELMQMIQRAAEHVAERHAGSVLLVGDMSARHGGFIGGHRSHRSGRDVDFAFYTTDARRQPVSGFPLNRFDRFGVGVRDSRAICFDPKRNWLLVEALLTHPRADVQWIFVSLGLKALLLEWALENKRDLEIIERAATVLHQPGDSAPHDDHFHVRIYCPRSPASPYCVDTGPIWPWVSEKRHPVSGFTPEELARLALD